MQRRNEQTRSGNVDKQTDKKTDRPKEDIDERIRTVTQPIRIQQTAAEATRRAVREALYKDWRRLQRRRWEQKERSKVRKEERNKETYQQEEGEREEKQSKRHEPAITYNVRSRRRTEEKRTTS